MPRTARRVRCQPPGTCAPDPDAGVAVSADGLTWLRGEGGVEGTRGEGSDRDVGSVLGPSDDWWAFDTRALAVSDVQIFSNGSVSGGVGVYWMLYSGSSYESALAPAALVAAAGGPLGSSGGDVEGACVRRGWVVGYRASGHDRGIHRHVSLRGGGGGWGFQRVRGSMSLVVAARRPRPDAHIRTSFSCMPRLPRLHASLDLHRA